jgi:cytoskeletal protein CcmA (bactofilin family)
MISLMLILLSLNAYCAFDNTDLKGDWRTYGIESDSVNHNVFNGTHTFNSNGTLVNSTTYNNGQLTIDSKGYVSGNLENSEIDIHTIISYMSRNKNIIDGSFKAIRSTSRKIGEFTWIKIPKNVSDTDLQGKWELINFENDKDSINNYFSHGYIKIDNNRNIYESDIQYVNGDSISIDSTSINFNNNGKLTGTYTLDSGITVNIKSGQINRDKNFLVIIYKSSIGNYGIMYFVKYNNSFQMKDLAANWHLTNREGDEYSLEFSYGNIKLNKDGNLLSGSYETLDDAETGDYTSGNIGINNDGILSGKITNEYDSTTNLISGKISSTKNFGIFAFETDYGTAGGGIRACGSTTCSLKSNVSAVKTVGW